MAGLAVLLCLVLPTLSAQRGVSSFITVKVLARESRDQVTTARFYQSDGLLLGSSGSGGGYAIPRPGTPQRVRVAAIGYQSREVTVDPEWVGPMIVELEAVITTLTDLAATTTVAAVQRSGNTWTIDGDAPTAVPVAVEPDVFRILALSPAVSFASIRSSRPLIRGIDADDTGFSIDGHEVVNLYHLGRSFSGFPAIASEQVSVATQPTRVDVGHTTSGRVEIRGLEWSADRQSEIQYGLGAWSAVTGIRNDAMSAVVAGRTIAGSVAGGTASGGGNDLHIYDFYGRLDSRAILPVSVTLFHSIDRGSDDDPKQGDVATLDWSTTLIGARADLLHGRLFGLTLSGSYSGHTERGDDVPARGTTVQLDNRHARLGGRLDGTLRLADPGVAFRIGADLARRDIQNEIVSHDPQYFRGRALDHAGTERGAYAELETPLAGGVLRSGVRVDAFDEVTALQPRFGYTRPVGRRMWFGVNAGRAARLVHLISDARAEPKVGYYDLWLPADGDDIPVAVSDHLSAELGWQGDNAGVRFGVFHSTGEGQMDLALRISRNAESDAWRVGQSRVRGAEVEATASSADRRWTGQMSYTLAESERDWGAGWVPWINDRRHQLRVTGSVRPLQHTVVSPSIELNSGQPYTPFRLVERAGKGYRTVFGAENEARGSIGVRFGAAIQQELKGPFDSDLAIGVSVTNVGLGDQAPREAELRFAPLAAGEALPDASPSSRQMSELPMIPSLLLRVRF